MNYMDDASTFERSLLQKARQKHIPVTGALELLPLCNMNCDIVLCPSVPFRNGTAGTASHGGGMGAPCRTDAEGRYRFSSSDRWGAAALSGF